MESDIERLCCYVQFKLVTPVGDRVLVKVDKEEARTVGGVLLPASARNRPTAGAIVAVGEGSTVKVSLHH